MLSHVITLDYLFKHPAQYPPVHIGVALRHIDFSVPQQRCDVLDWHVAGDEPGSHGSPATVAASSLYTRILVQLFAGCRTPYSPPVLRGIHTDLAALYNALAAVVNRGDYDAIGPMVQSTYDAPEDGALVQRILLAERNAAWLARLRTELDQGNAAVVVGAAHLGGADGLIALLNQAGYRTRTVAVPAAD